MKNLRSKIVTGFAVALGMMLIAMQINSASQAKEDSVPESKSMSDTKLLRHVVMFQFKPTSSEEDIQTVVAAFQKLPEQIPQIVGFEFGTNNSPEGLDNGFTHCFLLSFANEADRAVYLPHPAHAAFGKVLKPHLERVLVVDYLPQ